MKIIKYNICTITEEGEFLSAVEMGWSEVNEEIAKLEAYNGEYSIEDNSIEDNGQPESAETPSQLDIIEAQVTYTAMMTGTLLEV